MNKMEMINYMKNMIEEDSNLDISKWESRLDFTRGDLVEAKLTDLNAIKIKGMPEPKPGEMTSVEMIVQSASGCYATTLHLLAYNKKINLDKVTIIFNCQFAKAPFLGIREGNSGMVEPSIDLFIESETDKKIIKDLAEIALKRSPVLSSLKEEVELNIK